MRRIIDGGRTVVHDRAAYLRVDGAVERLRPPARPVMTCSREARAGRTTRREEPLRFGLKGREVGHNPFSIALGEWRGLLADVGHVRGLTAKLKTRFGAP